MRNPDQHHHPKRYSTVDGKGQEAQERPTNRRDAGHDNRREDAIRDGDEIAARLDEGLDEGLDDTEPRESAGRALTHIGIGFVLFAMLLGGYVWWAQRSHAVKQLQVEAAPLLQSADVTSLRSAEKKYLEALSLQANNDHTLGALAELYALLWVDHGFAEAEPQAKLYADKAVQSKAETASRFAAEALVAYGEGRYEDAVRVARMVIDRGGVSEKFYFALGVAQRAAGQLKDGRESLRRAQDLSSTSPAYARALGDAFDADGDKRNAAYYWGLAAKANSNYIPGVARNLVGQLRTGTKLGKVAQEIDSFSAIPEHDLGRRDRAAVAEARSALLYHQGHLSQALAAVEQGLQGTGTTEHRPAARDDTAQGTQAPTASAIDRADRARLLWQKGQILLAQGQPADAVNAMAAAHDAGRGGVRYLYALARAHAAAGEVTQGVALLAEQEKGLKDDPTFYTIKGDIQRDAGQLDEARSAYDEALKLQSDHTLALLGRATIAWKSKKYDDARGWFEKAAESDPEHPEIFAAVGLMWIEMGAPRDANVQLEAAERLYRKRGTDAITMQRFYTRVQEAYGATRGGSAFVKSWKEREKAFLDTAASGKS